MLELVEYEASLNFTAVSSIGSLLQDSRNYCKRAFIEYLGIQ